LVFASQERRKPRHTTWPTFSDRNTRSVVAIHSTNVVKTKFDATQRIAHKLRRGHPERKRNKPPVGRARSFMRLLYRAAF